MVSKDEFHLSETAPSWVKPLSERDYKGGEGDIKAEVGVHQVAENGNGYWKSFQLIDMGDHDTIRTAYYTETGGYQNKPLMLPPSVMTDLVQFADGKVWQGSIPVL